MQQWGNQRVNAYYEATLPQNYPHPNEHTPVSEMEKFIRQKYVENGTMEVFAQRLLRLMKK